ncbi:hypothetical protein DID75_01660 [Candidatus Marinamargulisbacteria bacterium SCGC AG-410-N11]|nr:hypothetical protein DID75_01660 [Candidatus Marinamargulisbacteria bacterium SCGC AG-410-N11]
MISNIKKPYLFFNQKSPILREIFSLIESKLAPNLTLIPSGTISKTQEELLDLTHSVTLIDNTKQKHTGLKALFQSLQFTTGIYKLIYILYAKAPLFSTILNLIGKIIQSSTILKSLTTKTIHIINQKPESFSIGIFFAIKITAFLFLLNFIYLLPQLDGLFYSNGLTPITSTYNQSLSIFNFITSNSGIFLITALGIISSSLWLIGILPLVTGIVSWLTWASFVNISPTFMQFQWDTLLIEAGLIALLTIPLTTHQFKPLKTTKMLILIYRLLLFRIFLTPGINMISDPNTMLNLSQKLISQPFPSNISWLAYHLPNSAQIIIGLLYIAIHILGPIGLFLNRKYRHLTAICLFLFSALMIVCGNLGIFYILTAMLCLTQLDDKWFFTQKGIERYIPNNFMNNISLPRIQRLFSNSVVTLLIIATLPLMLNNTSNSKTILPIQFLYNQNIINKYQIIPAQFDNFTHMNIYSSTDSYIWNQINTASLIPTLTSPFKSRLEFKLWELCHLGTTPKWFTQFQEKLMQNSPEVISLISKKNHNIKYLHFQIYQYTPLALNNTPYKNQWWDLTSTSIFKPKTSTTETISLNQ